MLTALTHQETAQHLQELIRLDTSNPPGNETQAAAYLASVLRVNGIEPVLVGKDPNRLNLVARLPGSGELPPLLLYSHTDVVPAEPGKWQHHPFSGDIAEGCVWGRGAVDMKGTLAQQLTVFLELKRRGIPLKRDVILAATADEEVGGEDGYGIGWVAQHHPDLIRAEFGLTELGGYTFHFGGRTLYPIQVAEKGVCWVRGVWQGRPGHASAPHTDNAVVHASRAVAQLAERGLGYHLTPASEGFLHTAGNAVGGELGAALHALTTPEGARAVLNGPLAHRPERAVLNAMVHNTASPTGLRAGYKTNVIPGEAEVTFDGRLLPGQTAESFLAELRAALTVPGAPNAFELEVIITKPPLATSHTTPLFDLMARTLQQHDPNGVVLPYLMTGATDAKHLAPLGMPSYGFAPMQIPAGMDFFAMFHAHNERAPLAGLAWGTQVLFEVVTGYCA